MNTLLIFIWVLASFVVMAFLDAVVEGPNPWEVKHMAGNLK